MKPQVKSKSDIVDYLHKTTVMQEQKLTKAQIGSVVNETFDKITRLLNDGYEVRIDKFGGFVTQARPERMGRNPATGEPTTIKASTAVKFKASKTLKDAVA